MVGFAYSADPSYGYEYIVIKAYNCDDISFINQTMPYQVYRVHRHTGKVTLVIPRDKNEIFHLNLSYINEITSMLTLNEYEASYPLCLTWSISPSGKCVKRNIEDNLSIWPIPPVMNKNNDAYINITSLCFKSLPSPLELSFVCDIMNNLAYMCSVFQSEAFVVCGSALYISSYMLSLEQKVFKSNTLGDFYKDVIPIKLPRCRENVRKILSSIKNTDFSSNEYGKDVLMWIVNIKRECISDLMVLIEKCLNNNKSLSWLIRRMKHRVYKSLDILLNLGTELLVRSSLSTAGDIKYLSFEELLCAFSFADSMRDITKTIAKSKLRRRSVKKLTPPALIYKGKFFYNKN